MAIERAVISGDRILLTKPGFPAVPGVAEEGKIFDSAWDFTGTLLARGTIIDTSVRDPTLFSLTPDANPQQVAIPLAFTPREVMFLIYASVSQDTPFRNFTALAASRFTYSGGILSISRQQYPGSNPALYLRTDWVYRALSI